jgi:hypothetical protein
MERALGKVRFARLIHSGARVLGGPAVRAACGGNLKPALVVTQGARAGPGRAGLPCALRAARKARAAGPSPSRRRGEAAGACPAGPGRCGSDRTARAFGANSGETDAHRKGEHMASPHAPTVATACAWPSPARPWSPSSRPPPPRRHRQPQWGLQPRWRAKRQRRPGRAPAPTKTLAPTPRPTGSCWSAAGSSRSPSHPAWRTRPRPV